MVINVREREFVETVGEKQKNFVCVKKKNKVGIVE